MALKVDFRHFLDDEGKVLSLTKQAKTIFEFLAKIVVSVSQASVSHEQFSQQSTYPDIEQPFIEISLKCNSRADELYCLGNIEANYSSDNISVIEWHCNTCEAAGTITNWQASLWDKQKRTMH